MLNQLCLAKALAKAIRKLAVLFMPTFVLLAPTDVAAQSPGLTDPPVAQTVFFGDPATFQATATGGAPLAYQWLRDGTPIAGASASSYTLPAVANADHQVAFAVRVTNSLGSVTSAPALLTVDFGLPGAAVTNRVVQFNSIWRYNLSNNLDGVGWTASGYDDSVWSLGPGLLAAENNSSITPLVGTQLLAPDTPPPGMAQGHAYYFRTKVVFPTNNLLPGVLVATLRADDGALIFVNGGEALRLRLLPGAITNTSFATSFPPGVNTDATVDEVHVLDVLSLAPGTNVLAVSVHQANATSSDTVWGMALDVVSYQRMRDTTAPTIAALLPAPGSTLAGLTTLEVHFSEGVKGVDAADLLINNQPATNVVLVAPDVYVFQFPPPPTGSVSVVWKADAGIVDLSANSNSFGGGNYGYIVNPAAIAGQVRLTEFMAGNDSTIRDNDGEFSDWVEIYNGGSPSLNLGGWYLTDDAANRTKWRLPAGVVLPANSYLVVWASEKNRTNAAAPLHTNFKLSKSAGGFLGLVYSDGVTVISSFTNYPAQEDDVSYGRDRLDPAIQGYFTNATPGAANATVGVNFAPVVQFSRPSGTFVTPFPLVLTAGAGNTIIRYFLVTNAQSAALTNVPNSSSPLYTGPLNLNSSVQVRARAFSTQGNVFPSAPATETYLRITSSAAAFSSDVPIALFHNFGAGTPPATFDQSAVMMVFGTDFGRASMANPPDLVTRIGINIRGSSTEGMAKKSFAVEAWDEFNDDQEVPVLGMPAESDWVFYAPNGYDKPWIHNPLMHELSRQIGRYSPRVRMVEVFNCFDSGTVNYTSPTVGHYGGVYVLEEKIKADGNRVNVPRLDPVETNAPAVTGGYVLKIDRRDDDERSFGAANQTMVFVEPQMKDYDLYPGRAVQRNYIAGYFNSFYSALTGPNWTNPVTGYTAWLDVDSWIDHHILNVLALSSDAMRLSAYFFKDRGKRIEMGPLWDFDRGLGSSAGGEWRSWNPRSWVSSNPAGSGDGTDFGTDYFNPANVFGNPWYSRLLQDPDFWQKWIDRYQSLRPTGFSTNVIFGLIDQLTNKLAVAQSREIARWSESAPRSGTVLPPVDFPDRSYSHSFPGTYAGEIAFLKRWLADRLHFIDTNFLVSPTLSRTGGLVIAGQTLTLTPAAKAGSRLLYTLNGTDPRLPGGAISPVAFSNNASVVLSLTNNIRVFARSWNPAHQNLTGLRRPPISSPWSGANIASYYTTIPALRVTELMFHPPSAPPGNTNAADNFEFIELQNTGASSLNVLGFRLSGGIEFTFPSLTLTGGQFVAVVKDLAAFRSRYGQVPLVAGVYTNNLANSGDRVVLQGSLLEPILDFEYADSWYPAADGQGFSLVIVNALAATDSWNVRSSWRPSSGLHGSPGAADPSPPAIPSIVVNEALAHTDPPLRDEIELFNPTGGSVDLGGWFLTDDPHEPKKFRIQPGTYISGGGWLTFDAEDFSAGANGFALGSTGDSIYLFSGDANTNLTGYAHGSSFGASPNPVSFGRYVNSQAREHLVLQSINSLGARNAYPRVGPVVVSEIMYHPPDLPGGVDDHLNEFVEMLNVASTNVPLFDVNASTNTWRLRDAVDFNFPTNVTLPPGGRLLVVGFDPAIYTTLRSSFIFKYGVSTNVPILGPWSGKLDNSGDMLELERPDAPNLTDTGIEVPYYVVEKIAYADTSPWPGGADGGGASLQRVEPTLFGNEPFNWQAAAPTAGTNGPGGVVDVDQDGLPDVWELANGFDPQIGSGEADATSDLDGDGANTLHEFIAGTNPNDPADCLRFSSVTAAGEIWRLEFPTELGRRYAVETLDHLGTTNTWATLTNGITGTGGSFIVTDTPSATRYYRLKVALLP